MWQCGCPGAGQHSGTKDFIAKVVGNFWNFWCLFLCEQFTPVMYPLQSKMAPVLVIGFIVFFVKVSVSDGVILLHNFPAFLWLMDEPLTSATINFPLKLISRCVVILLAPRGLSTNLPK